MEITSDLARQSNNIDARDRSAAQAADVAGVAMPLGKDAGNVTNNAPPTLSDKVSISDKGKRALDEDGGEAKAEGTEKSAATGDKEEDSPEVKRAVEELKSREREVIAHEQAHKAVGGRYAGAPSYERTTGPDGKSYISGGEVSIDTSKERSPEETAQKMAQVRAAALAPANPSAQDMSVASTASQMEAEARAEIAKARTNGEGEEGAFKADGAEDNAENKEMKGAAEPGNGAEPTGDKKAPEKSFGISTYS